MRPTNIGRIKVKIDDKRIRSRVWGVWSIRRSAICIAKLASQMAEDTPRNAEYVLAMALEVLNGQRNRQDDNKEEE